MSLVPLPIEHASASSVLGGDEETYGALNVLDGREDTCWNSDGGAAQALVLTLARASAVAALELVFQGGFVGQEMRVGGRADGVAEGAACSACSAGGGAACPCEAELGRFQPLDANEPQRFALLPCAAGPVRQLRVTFAGSTDFYGRVVVYAARVFTRQDPDTGPSAEGGGAGAGAATAAGVGAPPPPPPLPPE